MICDFKFIKFPSKISYLNIEDKKILEKIILVEVPNEVYPTLYETFKYLFSQAGIKNIRIEKEVNFEKLYNEKNKS